MYAILDRPLKHGLNFKSKVIESCSAIYVKRKWIKPGVVAHANDSSTREAEAGGLGVQAQPGIHEKFRPA
jgi:hypothetical protein